MTYSDEESNKMKMLAGLRAIMDVTLLGAISGNYLAR